MQLKLNLTHLSDTELLAKHMAQSVIANFVVTLNGNLGAGKTTLVRSILRELGITGTIKSPTFTLVEPYQIELLSIYHFDLYRFANEHEWYDLGFDEYFTNNSLCFIEWADKAMGLIPQIDWQINLNINGEVRIIEITTMTAKGEECLKKLTQRVDKLFN